MRDSPMRMTKLPAILGLAFAVSVLSATLYGCQKPEGPAEKAGKEIDQGAAKAGQQIEKAGHSVQNAAKGDQQQ
ncbi:hypothetical protein [Thiomonas sp. FB-Cd]|uniref:hypothetical protein n=1 Tax=Thiomonas sp. FB-Cd TaxID=1158292 RepID=UPI001E608EA7|nr:hypothetical protein [Thiomonas sp. FB-Cd]